MLSRDNLFKSFHYHDISRLNRIIEYLRLTFNLTQSQSHITFHVEYYDCLTLQGATESASILLAKIRSKGTLLESSLVSTSFITLDLCIQLSFSNPFLKFNGFVLLFVVVLWHKQSKNYYKERCQVSVCL